MTSSEQIDQLSEALVRVQAEGGGIVKDREAQMGKYEYTYADLAAEDDDGRAATRAGNGTTNGGKGGRG